MTHVKIGPNDGAHSVQIDGVEVANHILAEGFGVEFDTPSPGRALVRMVVVADTLDICLPDAVLQAIRQDDAA